MSTKHKVGQSILTLLTLSLLWLPGFYDLFLQTRTQRENCLIENTVFTIFHLWIVRSPELVNILFLPITRDLRDVEKLDDAQSKLCFYSLVFLKLCLVLSCKRRGVNRLVVFTENSWDSYFNHGKVSSELCQIFQWYVRHNLFQYQQNIEFEEDMTVLSLPQRCLFILKLYNCLPGFIYLKKIYILFKCWFNTSLPFKWIFLWPHAFPLVFGMLFLYPC